jgi:YD repeat-containing protein
MLKMKYLNIIFILICCNAKAQTLPDEMIRKMTPLSPTAASLGVYGDTPVSLYTGVPDISVPIYEIHVGNFSLPISISYHASGIKVDEVASSVGLGWALNAGGVLNRNQRGIPDELMIDGYTSDVQQKVGIILNAPSNDPFNPAALSAASDFNQYDTESDIFNFSFPGGFGKFFIDPSGNYYFLPVNHKFKINFLDQGRVYPNPQRSFFARWIIEDNSGVKYVYGTTLDGRTDAYEQICTDGIQDYECEFNIGVNSWFLNEIILANDQRIKINYETVNYSVPNTLSTSLFLGDPTNNTGECAMSKSTTRGTLNYSRAMRIRQIIFPNGKVEFTPGENRNDLVGDMTLGSINVYSLGKDNITYTLEKSFQFSYSNGNRLVLNSIEETSPTGTNSKKYSFDYNNYPLPPRGSTAQDLWGYYNGQQTNFDLIPILLQPNAAGGFTQLVAGANRAVDPRYTQAGILTKITYPTGGTSEFVYENNTVTCQNISGIDLCSILDNTPQYPIDMAGGNFQFFHQNTEEVSPEFLMLPYFNSYLKIQTYSTIPSCISNSGVWNCISEIDLERKNDDGSFTTVGWGLHDSDTYASNLSGTYRLRVKWPPGDPLGDPATGYFFGIAISFPQEYKSPQLNLAKGERFGGGLRIKTINNYEPLTNKTFSRSYNYDYNDNDGALSGQTSGVLTNVPINFYNKARCMTLTVDGTETASTCFQTVLSSNTQANLLSHDGISVGYKKVKEIIGDGGIGMKEYYFTTVKDYPDDNVLPSTRYPFPPATSYEWRRGLTSTSSVRKDNGDPIKSSSLDYIFDNSYTFDPINYKSISCIKIAQIPQVLGGQESGETVCATYNTYSIYSIATESFYLDKQIDTDYSSAGAATKTTYYAQDHAAIDVKVITTTDSKGRLIKTYFKYPVDFGNTGIANSDDALGVKKLLDFNMIKTPIEKINTITGSDNKEMIIGAILTTYFPDKPVPSKNYNLPIDTPIPFDASFTQSTIDANGNFIKDFRYKEVVNYKTYDNFFNPVELNKTNDVSHSFVWGYNNVFVIAEAKNASANLIFHTSFEETNDGGNSAENDSKTGKYSKVDGYANTLTGLSPNTSYMLTYWQKTGAGWTLQTQLITLNSSTTSYSISLTGQVDEVRFYPQGAQMSTYTYEPIIGVTSITDPNGLSTYYEYDEFGRLKLVRDSDRNIVKRYNYQYKLD